MSSTTANAVRADVADVLWAVPEVEAAAVYGSVARGDSEDHSDIDLLLLVPASQKRVVYDRLYEELVARFPKVSITLYTRGELQFLRAVKSLFVLHLSRESLILFDRAGKLSSLLENFEPRASYHEDFVGSIRLLDPLRTVVLGAPNNFHRLSYVYSLFRVFGVYLLAEKHIYEFSKSKMAAALRGSYPDVRQFIDSLSGLRLLNTNFFVGGEMAEGGGFCGTEDNLRSYLHDLGRFAMSPLNPACRGYEDAVAEFSSEARDEVHGLEYRMRVWFLLLVYDGLNLYFRQRRLPTLHSFDICNLTSFDSAAHPEAVRVAIREAIEYMRSYPLKYFLLENARIPSERAQATLSGLADLVSGPPLQR